MVRLPLAPPPDPGTVRQAADDILSQPKYRPVPPSLISRIGRWISERLADIFSVAFQSGHGYWFGYAVLAVALLAVGYLLWRVFPRTRPVRPGRDPEVAVARRLSRSRRDWLDLARRAEAARQWADAVHARYHALTTGLADRAELPAEPSTTSGEHRRHFTTAAAANPGRVGTFEQATDRYEGIWFGGRPAEAGDAEALAAADHRLVEDRS